MNTVQNKSVNSSSGVGAPGGGKWAVRLKILLLMMFIVALTGHRVVMGQGVGISEISISPDASSILELRSVQRGLLIPRMTTGERLAIASPAQGLLVYDTVTKTFWVFDGTWKAIASKEFGTPNQLLGMDAAGTANEYKTLLGTLNQVNVAHAPGSITLSLPQDIDPTNSPTFAGLTLTSPLTVPSGGTGINNIPLNSLIYGNNVNPVQTLAPSGTNGAVLTTLATGAPGWKREAMPPAASIGT